VAWVAVWALIPWLNAGANLLLDTGTRSAIWEQSRALVVANYAALSIAIVIAVWGSGRIARRLETLPSTTANVLAGDVRARFRHVNDTAGPLAGAAATAIAFAVSAFADAGWVAAALRGVTWVLVGIAIWSFLWTYASLQLGLNALGREPLVRTAAHADPALGLRPLGGVAFTGLWLLFAALVPVLLTGLPDVVGVAIGLLVLSGGLAAFFLSLVGLHRQMVAAKEGELAVARDLYARAYEPVRTAPTLEALEQQKGLLGAADALEKRALAIHEWPIDEGTVARVITVATSVVAMAVARLILDPFGL
jgi:hypothetical protein